jgi:hypothetical protein
MSFYHRTAAGTALTADILDAIADLVHDKPTDLVIEAIAGAMLVTVATACPDSLADQSTVLRRYAERIDAIARVLG